MEFVLTSLKVNCRWRLLSFIFWLAFSPFCAIVRASASSSIALMSSKWLLAFKMANSLVTVVMSNGGNGTEDIAVSAVDKSDEIEGVPKHCGYSCKLQSRSI